MSSEMNRVEDQHEVLVPGLRFPEFQSENEWTFAALGSFAKILNQKVGNAVCIPLSVTSGVGLVSQIEKFGRVIAGDSYRNYIRIQKDNFAYNKSATKDFPEGFIARYKKDESAAVPNSIFTAFTLNTASVVPAYLDYIFEKNTHGKWLRQYIEVGSRAHGSLSVSDKNLLSTPIPVPLGRKSIDEQQKIADFLNSLDELITAQSCKVDLLKLHKKGLMQQLFPREGETVPRLRFAGFEGEWRETTLGQLARLVRGPFGGSLKKEIFVASGYAVYEQQHAIYSDFSSFRYHITAEKFHELRRFAVTAHDIIMSCSGTMGKFAIIPDVAAHGVINQALLKLTPNGYCDTNFLKEVLELPSIQEKLLSQSAGGAIQNVVSVDQIKALTLRLPSVEEQKAVVGCLSDLDALITEETQRLESLKIHKKGLMQGLFPIVEELNY